MLRLLVIVISLFVISCANTSNSRDKSTPLPKNLTIEEQLAKKLAHRYGSRLDQMGRPALIGNMKNLIESLNKMCREEPEEISNIIEIIYEEFKETEPQKGIYYSTLNLYISVRLNYLQEENQINCTEWAKIYSSHL